MKCAAVLRELSLHPEEHGPEALAALCAEPLYFEEILQKLFAEYALTMNFEQYVLVGSTVRSYLSWLRDQGKLKAEFRDNMLVWCG